jgi:hypothetical protein
MSVERTNEEIDKEERYLVFLKLIISVLAMLACAALWMFTKHWSLLTQLLVCGFLLVVLYVLFVFGMLGTASYATSASTVSRRVLTLSSFSNLLVLLAGLLMVATGVALIWR